MTSRWLKDEDGNFIKGKNGNKLRYLFYKKTNNVKTTFDKNWTDEAISMLSAKYDNIERVETKRGRPKKDVIDIEPSKSKKVKRKNEKKIEKTAAVIDTSDDEEILFEIDGYNITTISGRRYYINDKGWLFDSNGRSID